VAQQEFVADIQSLKLCWLGLPQVWWLGWRRAALHNWRKIYGGCQPQLHSSCLACWATTAA